MATVQGTITGEHGSRQSKKWVVRWDDGIEDQLRSVSLNVEPGQLRGSEAHPKSKPGDEDEYDQSSNDDSSEDPNSAKDHSDSDPPADDDDPSDERPDQGDDDDSSEAKSLVCVSHNL